MTQALFLMAVCPPAGEICPAENDPIYEEKRFTLSNAFDEVAGNLDWVATCSCPCKKVRLVKIDTDTDEWGTGEVEITYIRAQGQPIFSGDLPSDKVVEVSGAKTFSVTKGQKISLRLKEDDDWSADDIVKDEWNWFDLEDSSSGKKIEGWFNYECNAYERKFKLEDGSNLWTLYFEFTSESCPGNVCKQGYALP